MGEHKKPKTDKLTSYTWTCKRCNTLLVRSTKEDLKKARLLHTCDERLQYVTKHERRLENPKKSILLPPKEQPKVQP